MSEFYQQLVRVSGNPFAEEQELAALRAQSQNAAMELLPSATGAWASCDTCCDPGTDPSKEPGPENDARAIVR
jgi:hypothetical protein